MSHSARVYTTKNAYLASWADSDLGQRHARRRWKQHTEKHGNVPLLVFCHICSGKHNRIAAKRWQPRRAIEKRIVRKETDFYKFRPTDE